MIRGALALVALLVLSGCTSSCPTGIGTAQWSDHGVIAVVRELAPSVHGDTNIPSPEDQPPYLSALESIAVQGRYADYVVNQLSVHDGRFTAIPKEGTTAELLREETLRIALQLTGNQTTAAVLADAARQQFSTGPGPSGGYDAMLALPDLTQPWRLKEARQETQGNTSWRFEYNWASFSEPLNVDGQQKGRMRLDANGFVSYTYVARETFSSNDELQNAVREHFKAKGWQEPTFGSFSAREVKCGLI